MGCKKFSKEAKALIYGIIVLAVYFILCAIFASKMQSVAALKGYGIDAHAWAMCFWLGILGGIYVIALPDLIQQKQNQQLIELLKEKGDKNA